MDEATTTSLESVLQSAKVSVFLNVYSMNHEAPRRDSQGRNFGVYREQDFAADIVSRRPCAHYVNRMKNKRPRNMVWRNDNTNGPTKSPALGGTGQCVSNQPRKNASYGPTQSPALGSGQRVSNQPRKNGVYGPRSSSVSDTRGWGSSDKGSPKSNKIVCKFWIAGNCKYGDKCHFLHSWACFPGLSMVASLEGHEKVLTFIMVCFVLYY